MSLSQTQRSMFLTKKSQKSGKSASKQNEMTISPQQSLLDKILNSTSNPMSFSKEIDHTTAKDLYKLNANRTAGTTKTTMSPQSTNLVGRTNQKFLEEFKITWGEACKAFSNESENKYTKPEKDKILNQMVKFYQKSSKDSK
mmetsp:Transcript_4629/g.3890  ORF Transcript_4629/g.3890 Transcript_4629/m.3890 type:complete len:142 (+) Transcript_4629:76-501(+)